jgi:curved DNA-binding protein CbpA
MTTSDSDSSNIGYEDIHYDESNILLQKYYGSYFPCYVDDNYQYIEQERRRFVNEDSKVNDDSDDSNTLQSSSSNNENTTTSSSLKDRIHNMHNSDPNTTPIESNYYSLLNVPTNATATDIQRNFKMLSRIYHPDKISSSLSLLFSSTAKTTTATTNIANDAAQETFVQIKTAADVLLDPIYRLTYDIGGTVAVMLVKRSQVTAKTRKQQQRQKRQRNQQEQKMQESNKKSENYRTDKGKDSNMDDRNNDDDASSRTNEDDDNYYSSNDEDDDESTVEYDDLYIALQQVENMDEARLLIEEVLLEYIQHKQLQQQRANDYHRPIVTIRTVQCSVPLETNFYIILILVRNNIFL